jgi:hypothetical protein
MATYEAAPAVAPAGNAAFPGKSYVLVKEFDLAELSEDLKGAAFAAADILEAFYIPAGWFVEKVGLRVLTAEGAACTAHVGDGDDPDGFLVNANLNSTSTNAQSALTLVEAAPNTVLGYTAGKLYTAADTIDITFNSAGTDVAVFEVWVKMYDTNLY